MTIQQAYNQWSESYDMVMNKTRDIEAKAIRTILEKDSFDHILEIGCGTGKNTEWLITKAKGVTAVDFSQEMLIKAKDKLAGKNIHFIETDITKTWNFINEPIDLITCSLILEHIANLNDIYKKANNVLKPGGLFYVGELHSFKQYQGSKAKFETALGTFMLECFIHNISDYFNAAANNNFDCISLNEWFDDDDKLSVPRVITFIFQKR